MRVPNVKGEYFFKALFRTSDYHGKGWSISMDYFKSLEDAQSQIGEDNVIWPVEINCDGYCFVPDQEEIENGR